MGIEFSHLAAFHKTRFVKYCTGESVRCSLWRMIDYFSLRYSAWIYFFFYQGQNVLKRHCHPDYEPQIKMRAGKIRECHMLL